MVTQPKPWIETSGVLSLFPTLVWKLRIAPRARERINGRILAALAALGPPAARLRPGEAWQSEQTLHQRDELRELVGYIHDTARTVLRFLCIGYDAFEITGCWANIYPPGAGHRQHHHPNNFLSGVYYVKTQAGADTINFHDPRAQTGIIRPPVTALTAANTDQVVVRVEDGTLLVFPAYLHHSVDANGSDGERISISFNIMFSAFTERLSKPLW